MVSEMLKYRIYHKIIGILFGYYRILPYLCQCNTAPLLQRRTSIFAYKIYATKPEAEWSPQRALFV